MSRFGSYNPRTHFNAMVVLCLAVALAGCGDKKTDPKSPKNGQDSEMMDEDGDEGEDGLPALKDVEPAKEDIEVPPAP